VRIMDWLSVDTFSSLETGYVVASIHQGGLSSYNEASAKIRKEAGGIGEITRRDPARYVAAREIFKLVASGCVSVGLQGSSVFQGSLGSFL
jgi:hypothetical protein